MTEKETVLEALRILREQREGYEEAERREVLKARELGISWRDIAIALGRDHSSVWQKYRDDI